MRSWRDVLSALGVLALGVLALSLVGPARAESKLAFVVGINAYANLPPEAQLQRAVTDAESVGDALQSLGFTVTRVTGNGSLDRILGEFERFTRSVQPGDTVLFYYAGHGISLSDGNYLIPADVPALGPSDERIAKRYAVAEREIKQDLHAAGARVAVVVLDACRNNPFPARGTRAIGSATRGLARVDAADGVYSLYSAREGQAALDRLSDTDTDRNSVFTRVFLKELKTPGVSLSELGESVRDEVASLARGAGADQVPAVSNDLIGARTVYLAGPGPGAPVVTVPVVTVPAIPAPNVMVPTGTTALATPPPAVTAPAVTAPAVTAPAVMAPVATPPAAPPVTPAVPPPDEIAWSFLGASSDPRMIETFLTRYPQTARRAEAEARLAALRAVPPSPQPDTRAVDPIPSPAFAPAPPVAPSFNCAYARTVVEKLICDVPDLARADRDLAGRYAAAMALAGPGSATERAEGAWVRSRDACAAGQGRADIVACVGQAYRQRIAALAAGSDQDNARPFDARPSFDCARAAHPIEKLICTTPQLASEDRTLAALFPRVKAATASPARLSATQGAWLASRNSCVDFGSRSAVVACVDRAYRQRILELQAELR